MEFLFKLSHSFLRESYKCKELRRRKDKENTHKKGHRYYRYRYRME